MLCAPSPNLVFWKAPVQKSEKISVKKSDKFSSKTSKNPLSRILKPSLPKYLQEICHCLCGREGPLTPLTGIWFSDKITECCSSCFFSKNEALRFLEFCTKTAMDRKFNQIQADHFSEVRPSVWNPPWPKPCVGLSPHKGFTGLLTFSGFFFRELSFLVVPRAGPIR